MNVDRLFAAIANRPTADAVLAGDGESWRAAELLAAVDDLAGQLAGCRVVAVLADNGPAWVIADLACLRAGVVHLPLPAFFSVSQLAHALLETAADCILTDQPQRLIDLDLGFALVGQRHGLVWMQRAVPAKRLPAGTAKVSFTSGSSGAPKGVCLSAAGLLETALAVNNRLADLPIAKHLAVLPLALLLENSAGVYAPLLRGAQVVLPRLQALGWHGMGRFDAATFERLVDTVRPDSLILVPELLKAWTLVRARRDGHAPTPIYVAVGGARVAPPLLARARALAIPAYQGYGLTECGSVVSVNRPGDDGDDVGRVLDHVDLRIDGDEVVISTSAFLGYLGDPSPRPAGARREFATGDLGRLDSRGHLQLTGRRKNLLITSYGRNIAPEWVESVLLAQPAIAQAVVFGDGQPSLSAVLVPVPTASDADLAGAVASANAALPDYARVARWIVGTGLSAENGLATGNGRPLRAAVFNHYAAQLAALADDEETVDAVL